MPITERNPPKCNICKKNITQIKFPGLNCYMCKNYFHGRCVDLNNDILSSLLLSEASWPCPRCKPKATGRRSIIISPANPSQNNSTVLSPNHSTVGHPQQNSGDLDSIKSDISSMKSTIGSFQESLDFFSNKFDEFKSQLDIMESILTRVAELEKNNADLQENVELLNEKLNKLEQNAHCNDLILCGIPELENDNLSIVKLILNFLTEMNLCDVSPSDIKYAKRFSPRANQPPRASQPRPRKIRVKFSSEHLRDLVKSTIRSKKRETRTILFYNINVDFYAADYLTPFNNQLLNNARDFAQQNHFFKVWVSNHNVMLKKTSSSSPIIVRNNSDILKLDFNYS